MSGHKWFLCTMCGPAVLCGTCGNNSCNGGIGRVGGDVSRTDLPECPDCRASWEWEKANKPPAEMVAEWDRLCAIPRCKWCGTRVTESEHDQGKCDQQMMKAIGG